MVYTGFFSREVSYNLFQAIMARQPRKSCWGRGVESDSLKSIFQTRVGVSLHVTNFSDTQASKNWSKGRGGGCFNPPVYVPATDDKPHLLPNEQ